MITSKPRYTSQTLWQQIKLGINGKTETTNQKDF